jgi:DNA-binding CsgD family transcriptional regulator
VALKPRLTQYQVNQILELSATGKSMLIVAGLVGVSRDTVKRYLNKGCACLGTKNTHTTKCSKWRSQ